MKIPPKFKSLPLPILAMLIGLFVFSGCGKLKLGNSGQKIAPPAKLICISFDSPDLLVNAGEIAKEIASHSANPGDRIVILYATRIALVDRTVKQPEWFEPDSEVRLHFHRELKKEIDGLKAPITTTDAEEFSQGNLLLHVQREFSKISTPEKFLIMVSGTFNTFATVDPEDLAVYGPEEVIEDLMARGMVSDLKDFRVYRTSPGSEDIKMSQLYDRFWKSYFNHAGAMDYRMIGWQSAVSEIREATKTEGLL